MMRSRFFLGIALAICLMAMPVVAAAAPITVTSGSQGWVRSDNLNNGGVNGNNTFTGNEWGYRHNSWAFFDLSSVSGAVTSATLRLELARYPLGASEAYTLDIFDVTTKTYTDLMTGNYYGSVTGNNGLYFVTLSAAAIADINAHLLGSISFGFTNATLNLENPNGVDLGIYINGYRGEHPESSPQLILNGAVPDAGSSLLLLGMALAGLRAARKRLL